MTWKNILIITLGATPPVVTETVWALLTREADGNPAPFVPVRIHLVTTARGKQDCQKHLIGKAGKLAELFAEFKLPLPEVEINLPESDDGTLLDDIRTDADNIAFANTMSRLIKVYADDPEARIHVSLAGGRKTMSYFAGAAISLFGRDQDELSHVLVAPDYLENCSGFWWPGQRQKSVLHKWETDETGQPKSHSIEGAIAEIASIPFVRMKHILREEAFSGGSVDHAGIVAAVQESLDAQRVVLICDESRLVVGSFSATLGQREFALYRLVAAAAKFCWIGAGPEGLGNGHKGWVSYEQLLFWGSPMLNKFLEYYESAFREGSQAYEEFSETLENKLAAGLISEARQPFVQTHAKLNRSLYKAISNPAIRERIKIVSKGKDPARFGLLLEPHEIEIG